MKNPPLAITRKQRDVAWTALALLAGWCLRAFFIRHAPAIAGDTTVYGDIAKNWLQHGVYGLQRPESGLRPTLIRLPGYPLFLAACFAIFGMEHYRAVLNLQALIDLGSCLLIAATARRLLSPRAGWIALWLAVLCPFTANYVAVGLAETLSIFCVAAAFYSLTRWQQAGASIDRWAALTGLSCAEAILLRPEQGLLAAAILPTMIWIALCPMHRREGHTPDRQKGALAFLSGIPAGNLPAGRDTIKRYALAPVLLAAILVALPLGPWAARNWLTFHVFEPLAPRQANDPGEPVWFGFQRWYRTWGIDFISTDQVYWHFDSDPILLTDLPARAFDSPSQRGRTAELLDEYNETSSASASLDRRFAEVARERIDAGKLRYFVFLPLARLANMLLRPRTELLATPLDWWNWRAHPRDSTVAAAFATVNLAYLTLATAGIARRRHSLNALWWAMLAFCLLRCALLATIDNSEPRYTLELFPLLLVFAAAAFTPRRSPRASTHLPSPGESTPI